MKQRLFWNWRGLSFVLVAFLGAAGVANSDPGYLRQAGPMPLRFSQPPHLNLVRFVLPAPVPGPEPASIAGQTEKAMAAAIAPKAPADVMQAYSAPPQQTVPSPSVDGVVPPQVFLKYFNQSTNGTVPASAPVNFNPPKPAGSASGAATSSNGP